MEVGGPQQHYAGGPGDRRRRGMRLLLATGQYVAISIVATTLFYRELYALQDYPQFSNMVNTVGTTITMGILALLLLVIPCCASGAGGAAAGPGGGSTWLDAPGAIGQFCCSLGLDGCSAEDCPVARGSLRGQLFTARLQVLLGALNALGNTLQLMAIDGLGSRYSTITTLLGQCTIPATIVLSRIVLSSRYTAAQLLGAATVVAGVAVAVVPALVHGHEGSASSDDAAAATSDAPPSALALGVWLAIFVVSCVPLALVNVLVERHLRIPSDSRWRRSRRHRRHSKSGSVPHPELQEQPARASSLRTVLVRSCALVCVMNSASIPFNLLGGATAAWVQHQRLEPLLSDYNEVWHCPTPALLQRRLSNRLTSMVWR